MRSERWSVTVSVDGLVEVIAPLERTARPSDINSNYSYSVMGGKKRKRRGPKKDGDWGTAHRKNTTTVTVRVHPTRERLEELKEREGESIDSVIMRLVRHKEGESDSNNSNNTSEILDTSDS